MKVCMVVHAKDPVPQGLDEQRDWLKCSPGGPVSIVDQKTIPIFIQTRFSV